MEDEVVSQSPQFRNSSHYRNLMLSFSLATILSPDVCVLILSDETDYILSCPLQSEEASDHLVDKLHTDNIDTVNVWLRIVSCGRSMRL